MNAYSKIKFLEFEIFQANIQFWKTFLYKDFMDLVRHLGSHNWYKETSLVFVCLFGFFFS